ncbi:PI-PLC domain-containing protein [Streptomyces sp. N2-109]|uniref:PI-PLC domain-containing protein n=1 Tax=Streptomyces gossypii TaxID=2883101 RepID=A0ABT2JXM1_9ACTN|nr:PI-PLC domain-containing protein [Streptomyces gossypii]
MTRVLAGVLAVLCVTVLVSAGTLRGTVLNRGFYQGVLDDERAYDRLYDEVLVDPEAQPVTRSLLARLPVPESVVTANLKTVLPMATVRKLTGDQIAALLRYLRGDTDSLSLSVDLTPVLANLSDLGEVYLGSLVSGTEERTEADLDAALEAMETALDDLAAGRRPSGLPRVELGDKAVQDATRLLLSGVPKGEREALHAQVEGALSVGDVATALAAVGPHLPGTTAGTGGEKAEQDLLKITDGGQWNVAEDLQNSGADTGALHSARGITHLTMGLVQTLAAGAGIAAVVLLWLFGPRTRARRLRLLARLLLMGGALTASVFLLARWLADAWLWTPPASWPPSLAALVTDLERTGLRSLVDAGLLASLLPLGAGLLLFVVSVAWERRAAGRSLSLRARKAALGGIGVLVTTTVVLGPALLPTAARGSERIYCNGSAELCDLRYDQVAYLASHNAMSSTADKFISPLQDADITTQLDNGARALLIDTHTWERPDEIAERLKLSEFAPDMQRQVTGLIDKASPPRRGLWLCHAICRAGAVPLVETLREVGDWLEEHPGELVTLITQDGISGEQTASAFREAGLEDLLFTPDSDPEAQWPTLGEMVEDDTRLVVFSESQDGPAPWYRNYYRYGMETPYAFSSPGEMSCEPNRGGKDKGLFLLNHFITHGGGSRIDAEEVNGKDFVLERARRCEAERGRPVNFIAVDFTNLGDAQAAVEALNAARTS